MQWQSDNGMLIWAKVNSEYRLVALHSGGFNGFPPKTKLVFKDGCTKDFQGEINCCNL
jgi:hypothetical protein